MRGMSRVVRVMIVFFLVKHWSLRSTDAEAVPQRKSDLEFRAAIESNTFLLNKYE